MHGLSAAGSADSEISWSIAGGIRGSSKFYGIAESYYPYLRSYIYDLRSLDTFTFPDRPSYPNNSPGNCGLPILIADLS
ncbi:unnamed protein product [Macrosiphum euphorbiae]|uniref:Uncharacterized protein n=1 Tax=Macrosiphum euphorbiae TaxID=13131 RepID=A0AAV0XLF0_9HEMI|nr:unnamed protein product [Macrosiphum euphorbiae]